MSIQPGSSKLAGRHSVPEIQKKQKSQIKKILLQLLNYQGALSVGYHRQYSFYRRRLFTAYIICLLQRDKFSWDELRDLEANSHDAFGKGIKILDILWQNGAIGYFEMGANRERREIFFDIQFPEFKIPRNKPIYVLRSCLIDACDIEQEREWDDIPVLGDGKR